MANPNQNLPDFGFKRAEPDSATPEGTPSLALQPVTTEEERLSLPTEGGRELTPEERAKMPDHPLHIGPPAYEAMIARAERALREAGEWDEDTIAQVLRPSPLLDNMPSAETLNDMYRTVSPIFEENPEGLAAARELFDEVEQSGVESGHNVYSWNILRTMANEFKDDTLSGLTGLARLRRRVTRKAGQRIEHAVRSFPAVQAGLVLLDTVARGLNKFRIDTLGWTGELSDMRRRELENEYLPSIEVEHGEEVDFYGSQAAAQWGLAWDTFTSGVEWVYHSGMSTAARIKGDPAGQTLHDKERAAIAGDIVGAASAMPKVTTAHVKPLLILEGIEAVADPETVATWMTDPYLTSIGLNMSEEDREKVIAKVREEGDLWPVWAEINDRENAGMATMLELTALNTGSEVVWDPFLWWGNAPAKAWSAARRGLGKAFPKAEARVLRNVARNTDDVSDLRASAEAHRKLAEDAERKATASARENNGVAQDDVYQEWLRARRAYNVEQNALAAKEGSRKLSEREHILLQRAGRRNPQFMPEPTVKERVTRELAPDRPAAETDIRLRGKLTGFLQDTLLPSKEFKNLSDDARSLVRRIAAEEQEAAAAKSPKATNDARRRRDELLTELWGKHKDEVRPIIRQYWPDDELLGVTLTAKNRMNVPARTTFDRVTDVRAKTVEELRTEQAEFRRRELVRDRDWALDLQATLAEDEFGAYSPTTMQRMLLGPDDMEQGGDTLNHLVRTGGAGIDDAAITPPNAMYSWDPAKVTSTFEWDLLDDVTSTEARLGFKRGKQGQQPVTQMEIGDSALRAMARERDRTGKALGAARRLGIKEDIEVLKEQLGSVDNALKKLKSKASKEELEELTKFDESWAPPQPTSLRKAGKLEQFIEDAPFHALRGLYPDSYHLTTRSKLYNLWAPIRDPLRFLRSHHPRAGEQLRLGYSRYENHTAATQEMFMNILERGRVVQFEPRVKTRGFKGYKVNQDRSQQLYDLLDTVPGSFRHRQILKDADADLVRAHDELRQVLDSYADVQGLTGTARYLQGYMRHIIDGSEFAQNARPLEFQGLSGKAQMFVSHLMNRTANKGVDPTVKRDIVSVLDLYNRAANRKRFLEPVLKDLNNVGLELAEQYGNTRYANYLKAVADNLKGKPSFLGQTIDGVTGKPVDEAGNAVWQHNKFERVLQGLTTALWMASIPFNPRYGLMQMTAGVTTTASRVGLLRTSRGMMQMMTKEGQYMARKLGFYGTVDQLMESNTLNKAADALGDWAGINRTEAYIRGVTAHAARDMWLTENGFYSWKQAVKAGMHHRILFDSMRMAENVNHMYGPLSRTPWLNRIFGQAVGSAGTQFTLYSLKQTEELISLANQNPGKLVTYFALSGWLNRLFAQHLGYDVTQWTGIGYTEDWLQGTPESPIGDLLTRMSDLESAMTAGNPGEIERAAQQFMKGLESFMPVILRNASRASERMETGVGRDTAGRYVRKLFLGENENILQRLATGLDPGLGTRPDPAPGMGGDLVPTLTMGPAIRDKFQRTAAKSMRKKQMRDVIDMRNLLIDYIEAMEAGDELTAKEKLTTLLEDHGVRIRSDDSVKSRLMSIWQARRMSQNLRFLQRNPSYIPDALEAYREMGTGLGME